MAGPDDIDSLLNQRVSDNEALDNLSHIEEDEKYMEEVNNEGGIVYDTDDS